MGFISKEQIERLKERIDIVDLINSYVPLSRAGASFKGLCPFHHEKTPSFMVNRERENFHCFGCHEGGDAISFIMKIENLEYIDAVKFIANKMGFVLEETEYAKEKEMKNSRLYKINSLAAKYYFKNLLTDNFPQEYLEKRGLRKKILNEYFIGYAKNDNGLYKFLKEQNISEEDMLELGLIAKSNNSDSYYDKFRDRLIFPIFNSQNKVIGFGGRTLINNNIKYLNSPESSVFIKGNNLYGVNTVKKSRNRDKVILVEGYMDVIALYNNGIDYALASLGTALTPNQAEIVKRYGKNIYIAYDSDEAGQKATLRAIEIFTPLNVNLGIIEFPNGMDPDEFVKKFGREEFDKLLKKAKKPLDFKLENITKKNLDQMSIIKEIIDYLSKISGNVVRDIYIDKAAKYLGVSTESLKRDVNIVIEGKLKSDELKQNFKFNNKGYNTNTNYVNSTYKDIKKIEETNRIRLERELVTYSMQDRESYEYLYKYSKEFLENEALIQLYNVLEAEYRNGAEKISSDIFKSTVFQQSGINKGNHVNLNLKSSREILDEILNRVQKFILKERQKEIQAKLNKELSEEERDDLVKELTEIVQKLTR
ncbi:MAG: DNA primase [Tissierellia bacterium]|nr:DNA primase [Tissierellia bacterium]